MFALYPAGSSGLRQAVVGERMELHLYCQYPSRWHPTALGGKYKITISAPWLRTMAPCRQRLVTLLQVAAPFVEPEVGVIDPGQVDLIEHHIKFTSELMEALPETMIGREAKLAVGVDERLAPEQVEGAPLRALRQLLDEVDPAQEWGGLKKVLTPEGPYLWLWCVTRRSTGCEPAGVST